MYKIGDNNDRRQISNIDTVYVCSMNRMTSRP